MARWGCRGIAAKMQCSKRRPYLITSLAVVRLRHRKTKCSRSFGADLRIGSLKANKFLKCPMIKETTI